MSERESVTWLYWLYQPYKWLIYLPLMLVISIVCALLAAVFAILVSPKSGSFWGMMWSKCALWLTPVTVKVEGAHHLKKEQSYVIAVNHQSLFDIFILYACLGTNFKWIMKKELRKVPFIGYASEKVGHIFIDRSSPRAAVKSLNEAKRKLAGGASVVIFPEGTRSGSPRMRPFKRGAFKLAFELELPILPITLVGSWRIIRKGFFNIVPAKTRLIIHNPIDTCVYKDDHARLVTVTQEIIAKGSR